MRPIKVLHIFSGDLWAGAEVMTFNLLSELSQNPHIHVIALALNRGALTDKLNKIGITAHIVPEHQHTFPGIIVKAYQLLKNENIDVIHAHRYKENIIGFILAKLLNIKKIVTTSHGLPESSDKKKYWISPGSWLSAFNFWLLRRYFNHTVAVSGEMKEVFIEQHKFKPENVSVIYNGIPIPARYASSSESTNSVLHIGTVARMVDVKNLALFLQVAAIIHQKHEDVCFSILGDGPLKASLQNEIKHLELAHCVRLLAPCADPTPFYGSLDIYMNTSIHEGIPLSILEAMSHSIPVIAPRVGGIPEIINDGSKGVLVADYTAEAFAAACEELLNRKDYRFSLGKHGRAQVLSTFNVAAMASSYLDLYRTISHEGTPSLTTSVES